MQLATWENILLGVMALGLLFWMSPGIKASLARGKKAPSDWMGALLPLTAVILFIIFLIAMV